MAQKFRVGDLARAGGIGRPMPACYPWLKRGQLLRVQGVVRGYYLGDHHLMYQFASRRGQRGVLMASFDLRRVEERDRAPGAGRRRERVSVEVSSS